ncbi:MAG: hypothetical protein KGO93_09775 [Cyanobacteria bacterium REEB446]|nr:hypothetical protein [Cyanobacteria bacterium REEB446]
MILIKQQCQYTKTQFDSDDERKQKLNSTLLDLGINKLNDDAASKIALQAIEISDAFENGEDTSKKMQGDLFGILVFNNSNFKNEKSQSKLDSDVFSTLVNLKKMNDSQQITKIFTLASYTTSTFQTIDSLTVGEMLADFGGQASEHDAWAHNKQTGIGGYSSSEWHDGDKSNNYELLQLKGLMPEDLLNLTFDNGEGYVFGKTAAGQVILLSKVDNEQLGKAGMNIQNEKNSQYANGDKDTAYNKNFTNFDDSKLKLTGRAGYNGSNLYCPEEFRGTSSFKIGDKNYEDMNTISVTRYNTPLILDLDGDGLELSSHTKGVNFDLTGDGVRDQTAWTKKQNSFDDAFLVLDSNKDGKINSGKELFGDQNGAENGFMELAKHDSNNDGVINEQDAIYKDLKLWADIDADGNVDEGEMKSLAELGLKSINTNFNGKAGDKRDEFGNDLSMQSTFTRELNGNTISGKVTDVLFINKDAEAESLDDISAILMKKMGEYSKVMGFQAQTIRSGAVKDDDALRLSAQAASKEIEKIILNNELDDIEQDLSQLKAELKTLEASDKGDEDTDNLVTTFDNTNNNLTSKLDQNNTNKQAFSNLYYSSDSNQTNSNNRARFESKNDYSSQISSVRNNLNDLDSRKTSIQSRMANLS